jgi:hypothetical protein
MRFGIQILQLREPVTPSTVGAENTPAQVQKTYTSCQQKRGQNLHSIHLPPIRQCERADRSGFVRGGERKEIGEPISQSGIDPALL